MSTEEDEVLQIPVLPANGALADGKMSHLGIAGIHRCPHVNEEFDAYWVGLFGDKFVQLQQLLGIDDRELLQLSKLAKLTADDSWVGFPCSVQKLAVATAVMMHVSHLGVSLPVATP